MKIRKRWSLWKWSPKTKRYLMASELTRMFLRIPAKHRQKEIDRIRSLWVLRKPPVSQSLGKVIK